MRRGGGRARGQVQEGLKLVSRLGMGGVVGHKMMSAAVEGKPRRDIA